MASGTRPAKGRSTARWRRGVKNYGAVHFRAACFPPQWTWTEKDAYYLLCPDGKHQKSHGESRFSMPPFVSPFVSASVD